MSNLLPLAQSDAAAALGGVGLFVFVLGLLFFIAPLGIWNRLIKIHRDQKADFKKAQEYRDAMLKIAKATEASVSTAENNILFIAQAVQEIEKRR